MGMIQSAKQLEQESEITLEEDSISELKKSVLNGIWETVFSLIEKVGITIDFMDQVRFLI